MVSHGVGQGNAQRRQGSRQRQASQSFVRHFLTDPYSLQTLAQQTETRSFASLCTQHSANLNRCAQSIDDGISFAALQHEIERFKQHNKRRVAAFCKGVDDTSNKDLKIS